MDAFWSDLQHTEFLMLINLAVILKRRGRRDRKVKYSENDQFVRFALKIESY